MTFRCTKSKGCPFRLYVYAVHTVNDNEPMFWKVENWRISFALNDHMCMANFDSYSRTGNRNIQNSLKKNQDLSQSDTEELIEQDDIEGN